MNHEWTIDAESLPKFLGCEVCGLGGPGAEASRLQPARQPALHHLPLIDLLLYCAYLNNQDCTFDSGIFFLSRIRIFSSLDLDPDPEPLLFGFFYGLVAGCHSFCSIHLSVAIRRGLCPLHLLVAFKLSGKTLTMVPSRESYSDLPYSKPTRHRLSNAAP